MVEYRGKVLEHKVARKKKKKRPVYRAGRKIIKKK
jgi:hypothetical protein